jgi:lipoprotein-releasing system permease protein
VPAVYVMLAATYCLALVTLGITAQLVLGQLILQPALIGGARIGGGLLLALMLVFAVATLFRVRRIQPGTPGRGRLLIVAIAGIVHLLPFAVLLFLLLYAAAQGLTAGLGGAVAPAELLLTLPEWIDPAFWASLAIATASAVVLACGCVSCWFLVPERLRKIVWIAVDVTLLLAMIFVSATMPLQPVDDSPQALIQPVIRLAVTVLFALRAFAWILPFLMMAIEEIAFQALVAARHLRARKSSFLATISILAIGAVTVSSCALTTTLSVMGGFRQDLKRKILGNNAHVVVDKEHDTFADWTSVLEATRATEGVVAASPYVSGEVMVTSASNLAGAVLRGIDPMTVSSVVDLERNLERGRLEYIQDPELLLDLPPEETRGPRPLQLPTYEVRERAPPAKREGSPVRDVDDLLDPMGNAPPAPGEDDEPSEIDEFLRGPEPLQAPKELLPGIIVGRELARSLRLFIGDEVNVDSPLGELGPAGPMPKSRPFRVAGIFYSGMYEYDMKYAYVTLETAQRFLNVGEEISGIEIKVDDVERAPVVAERIRAGLGRDDLRVQDWQETNKNLFGALALEKLAMFVALGIAIMVAGFCVFGTLTLMVQEKNREVGVLKALGTPSKSVVVIFMIEGLLIGLFGALLGLGLGYVVCFVAQHFGIKMDPEVYYIDKLPMHVDPIEFLLVGVSAVAVCLLATVFPAVLASKVRPVDALRYE